MHPRLQRDLEELGLAADARRDPRLRALIQRLEQHHRELDENHRWEALGRLSAGIAHEINTPIQLVGNSVSFLGGAIGDLMGLCADYQDMCHTACHRVLDERDMGSLRRSEEQADLQHIRRAIPQAITGMRDGIERVTRIVLAIKQFAHPGIAHKAPADLNAALLSTLTLAANELKYVAVVETELGELPPVTCYIGEINQVVLNLLVNAAHAVADAADQRAERGLIQVRTCQRDDLVEIAISDNGGGIPGEIQPRIFDPFFTTKEPGRGSGQGLALARSLVVDHHQGSLSFETRPGAGTTFFVRLPIDAPPAKAAR
jgi:two-component system, NtrC family, sensor kinase